MILLSIVVFDQVKLESVMKSLVRSRDWLIIYFSVAQLDQSIKIQVALNTKGKINLWVQLCPIIPFRLYTSATGILSSPKLLEQDGADNMVDIRLGSSLNIVWSVIGSLSQLEQQALVYTSVNITAP